MQKIAINDLKPHPQNNYFFDDIQGDNWPEFKKSIETSGILVPIVCTQDKVIVSGHQRLRVCKELDITELDYVVKDYDNEDDIIKDLIEINIRQRGIGNTNGVKLARCIRELERIYGVRQGSAGKGKVLERENLVPKSQEEIAKRENLTLRNQDDNSHPNFLGGSQKENLTLRNQDGDEVLEQENLAQKSQNDLAKELGMSRQQLQDYKKLLNLIPELQDLVETGHMPSSVGYKVWAKLSEMEQKRIVEKLGADYIQSLSNKQAESLVAKWKEDSEVEIKELKQKLQDISQQEDKAQKYKSEVERLKVELQNKPAEVIREVEKPVVPDDYEQIKTQLKEERQRINNLKRVNDEYKEQLAQIPTHINEMADAQKFTSILRKTITDISGNLKSCEQYIEKARQEDVLNQTSRAINEFNGFINQMQAWINKEEDVVHADYSVVK